MRELVLSQGWELRQRTDGRTVEEELADSQGWLAAEVPSTAHEVLWRAGKIPNPYESPSLARLSATFAQDFIYRLRFTVPDELRHGPGPLRLRCEGLDTFAEVYLNGHKLAQTDNMFCAYSIPCSEQLRDGEQELVLVFESALRRGKALEARYGVRAVWNGDASRVYVRKAQYNFGWDFGPPLLSAGPWRPIVLDGRPVQIAELRCPLTVSEDLSEATLTLHPIVTGDLPEIELLEIKLRVLAPDGSELYSDSDTLPGTGGQLWRSIGIPSPQLWWPVGYGPQPLYRIELSVSHHGELLDQKTLRIGARRLALQQECVEGGDGESFMFEINNRPIFCGGANWIPPELSLTRITRKQVAALLDEAVAAHMTMLRVWGGGIYESDDFYDLCDEKGLLVFQDFAFACGLYPGHRWFADSVAEEAKQAVERLRHHPSLVLWAGNNEDYSIAHSRKLYDGPRTDIPSPAAPDEPVRFDGRQIYEKTLREVTAAHDPSRTYWPGSPYGRQTDDPNDRIDGDCHIWSVWHTPQRDYQDYGELAGRFVSEFGMQGAPSLSTIQRGLGFSPDGISVLAGLNKGTDGPARLQHYLDRNLPPTHDLMGYIYATQLVQAETLAHGLRAFRRNFRPSDGQSCGGALIWQLDDCWPGISWSMLEHYPAEAAQVGRPVRRKPSFYAIRRELAPYTLGLAWLSEGRFAIWSCHSSRGSEAEVLRLRLTGFDVLGQQQFREERSVGIGANLSQSLGEVTLPDAKLVVRAELLAGETVLARSVLWPQPLKDLPLADPELLLEERATDDETVRSLRLQVSRPAKALWLSAGDDAVFSDNLLDLLPGEVVVITVQDATQSPIRVIGLHSLFAQPSR
jgi:beta-mannosidase